MNPIIGLVASLGGTFIERLFPDPEKRAAAQLELIKLTNDQANIAAANDLARDLAQAKINEVEAGSDDAFRAGWRPFIGWVCGVGFAVEFVVSPLLPWATALVLGHSVAPIPSLDTDTLIALLAGMLGLGTLRTVERVRGKA